MTVPAAAAVCCNEERRVIAAPSVYQVGGQEHIGTHALIGTPVTALFALPLTSPSLSLSLSIFRLDFALLTSAAVAN